MAVSAAIIAAPAAAAIARERREREEQQHQKQTSRKEEIHAETRTVQLKCVPEEQHNLEMLDAFIGITFALALIVILFAKNFISEEEKRVEDE